MKQHSNITVATLAAILSFSAGLGEGRAQEDAPKASKWETTAAAGLTLTSGNSDTFMATLSLDSRRKWERNEVALGIGGGYGESTINDVEETTAEFIRVFGQYNRLFADRFYGGLRLDGEYDGVAGVDYRVRVSPLLGYFLVKNDKITLAVEAGPTFIFEELEGRDADSYVTARFAERFEYKLTASTRIWQSLEYMPDVERWTEKYLIVGELGIDTAVTKKMSLRMVLRNNYDSEPAAGRDSNDLRLIAGVAYKF